MRRLLVTFAMFIGTCLLPADDVLAQRRLTPADIPAVKLDTSAVKRIAVASADDLLKSMFVKPSANAALMRALRKAGPEWAPDGELMRTLDDLSAEASKAIIQRLQGEMAAANRAASHTRTTPRRLASATLLPRQTLAGWRDWLAPVPRFGTGLETAVWFGAGSQVAAPETFTVFLEAETVAQGNILNERTETTMIYENRRVGVRMSKRTTIEKGGADASAVGRYFVELGTAYPSTGKRELDKSNPRRLKPTGSARLTMTEVTEAMVGRCPDEGGLSRGVTRASVVTRGTAAFGRGTAPSSMELLSEGTVAGTVDDAAALVGFEVDTKTDLNQQNPDAGTDLRIGRGLKYGVNTKNSGVKVSTTPFTVAGTGGEEPGNAENLASLMDATPLASLAHVTMALDMAQKWWRGKKCLELVVTSGGTPARLGKGDTRRVVVDARHLDEPAVPKIPVTGEPSSGRLSPKQAVTASAGFAFTTIGPNGGGGATFSSVSKRGIAKEISISFEEEETPDSISFMLKTEGIDTDTGESCDPSSEVLEGKFVAVRRDGNKVYYRGRARRTTKEVDCQMKPGPAEEVPCMTTLIGSADVDVTITTGEWEGNSDDQGVLIEGKPIPGSIRSTASGNCQASHAPWMIEQYKRMAAHLFRGMAVGPLKPGSYKDDGATLVIGQGRRD